MFCRDIEAYRKPSETFRKSSERFRKDLEVLKKCRKTFGKSSFNHWVPSGSLWIVFKNILKDFFGEY